MHQLLLYFLLREEKYLKPELTIYRKLPLTLFNRPGIIQLAGIHGYCTRYLILRFKKSYFTSDQTCFISNTATKTVPQFIISPSQCWHQHGKNSILFASVWRRWLDLDWGAGRAASEQAVQAWGSGMGLCGRKDLPEGYRSMTGRSSSWRVALPPLRVNRTMWYFPSLTNLELSSMLISSVPTLNTTLMLPLSWGGDKTGLRQNCMEPFPSFPIKALTIATVFHTVRLVLKRKSSTKLSPPPLLSSCPWMRHWTSPFQSMCWGDSAPLAPNLSSTFAKLTELFIDIFVFANDP